MFIISERHLRRACWPKYAGYFNYGGHTRRAPCAAASYPKQVSGNIIAKLVLGGLHKIYDLAA